MSAFPDLIVYGGGGHGKVVIETLKASGMHPAVVIDDDPAKDGGSLCGVNIRAFSYLNELIETGPCQGIAAIGNNAAREAAAQRLREAGVPLVRAIHPTSWLSPSAHIGEGSLVVGGVVVNADAHIGANVILNTQCSIDHDCIIEDGAHISPGARLGGGVTVGQRSQIGMGASVLPGIKIGSDTIIGAGAVVTHDMPDGVTAVGVPARILRK